MNNQDNYSYEEVLELTKQGIEIWRRIVIDDIVFDYEVSNLGRVRSLNWNGKGKRVGYGSLRSGYMSKDLLYTDKNGNKKRKGYLIHRLVATMFIANPDNKPYVDHISADKVNNKVDNLRWVTHEENMNNPNTKENISKGRKRRIQRKLTDEEKYPYVTKEDILIEEWKPIKGYEEIYEVSNMGRIKALGFKKNNKSRSKKGLLQPFTSNSYQKVSLTDRNSKAKTYFIHQLVAKHFIDNSNNYNIVDHINTNKADNRYFNLRWTTQKGNMNNDKTIKKIIIPVIVLDSNGNIISNGLGVAETAKNIGISNSLLADLLKSGKPYKLGRTSKKSLKVLEGIRIMYYEDYLKEHKND